MKEVRIRSSNELPGLPYIYNESLFSKVFKPDDNSSIL